MADETTSPSPARSDGVARPTVVPAPVAADTPPLLPVSDAKISMRGVGRVFAGRQTTTALGPINLDVAEGEFVSIVGPSGCGKSTLIRIVAGLLTPTTGEIRIRPGVGYGCSTAMVFQDHGIFPWKTVRANVRFGLDVAGVPRAEAARAVDELLERFGLATFAGHWPDQLSGGMRQRVGIARAFAVNPEIFLMDEPFAALDAQLRLLMQEHLLEVWQADRRTVLFITHSLDEALLLGDRVVVLSRRPGQVVADHRLPFGRPRSGDVRKLPEFGDLQAQIWDELGLHE